MVLPALLTGSGVCEWVMTEVDAKLSQIFECFKSECGIETEQ